MKKNSIYALMSAIALAGAVGFSGCSSSDDVIDNPDYNPEDNTVKTQFAISLQNNVLNKTRMAADNVQKDGTLAQFKGITGMCLLPFNSSSAVTSSSTLNGSVITLTPDIEASTSGAANEKVKVYSGVQIHTETNRFLFYGHAKSGEEGFEHGALVIPTSFASLSDINFAPKPINATINTSGEPYGVCKKLLELMTSVANAKAGNVTWGPTTVAGESQTPVVALQSMYNKFITMQAGSSQMVKDALEDIYNELNTMATTNEDAGHDLAVAIRTAILANANTVSGTAGSQTLTLAAAYSGYPGNLNLPDGAAYIKWNAETKKFEDNAINGTGNITPLTQYAYPANIQYFVESPIKTQTSAVLDETKTWAENLASYASGGTSVDASTRSVALVNQIKYGVARFDVSVAALKAGDYYDKKGVVVNVTNGFTLKGIIIGGQKPVDFKFEYKDGLSYTIYDNVMPTSKTITTSTGTGTNYTLVLQNKESDDNGINFALELVNNGADFEGKDGVIPAGGTFYLVGNLLPADATNYSGADDAIKNYVFKQDYYTIANCTIDNGTTGGVGGLANATNCLPDLTAPSMELGFSVDLTWKAGLEFDVTF